MGEAVDKLLQLLRKDEYSKVEQQEQILQENVTELYNNIQKDRRMANLPVKRLKYELELTKEIICECVSNLYISSLIIDEPEKYSDSLKAGMRDQCMAIMEDASNILELRKIFDKSSPYIKGMFILAETAMENKTDEDIQEFDNTVLLTPDDLKLIQEFEKIEGKDTYAEEIQDRVVDVYKTERELGEERNDKVQAIVDELSKIEEKKEDGAITESVEKGLNVFSNLPNSIFNSIFINKSKMILNESGGDLSSNVEEVLAETICTYTLLECIHSLGIKTFSDEDKMSLRYEFYTK